MDDITRANLRRTLERGMRAIRAGIMNADISEVDKKKVALSIATHINLRDDQIAFAARWFTGEDNV